MRVCVIGGGYVGLVTGSCLAELGHNVVIIDIDEKKVLSINEGKPPLFEAGLEEIVKKHIGKNLSATCSFFPVKDAELTMICVGTPPDNSGNADLHYVRSASESVGRALRNQDKKHYVVVKSTVPPGTTDGLVRETVLSEAGRGNIAFGMNPEFLREGRAVWDFFHPDRIVIGCHEQDLFDCMKRLYQGIEAPVIQVLPTEAEMIKYVSNAFLATKISFSNEIGNICKRMGIDVYRVMEGVGLDRRIGKEFFNAGVGFGGSCFPKDVMALARFAEGMGVEPCILKSVLSVNEDQPGKMISLLEKRVGGLHGKRIAVLGLAFKDNTDDIRESRAIPVIRMLRERGAHVAAYDPLAIPAMKEVFPDIDYGTTPEAVLEGADACLILTEWPEFSRLDKEFDLMNNRVIIEGRRVLKTHGYEGICW